MLGTPWCMTIMALGEQRPDLFAERGWGGVLRDLRRRGGRPRAAGHAALAAQPLTAPSAGPGGTGGRHGRPARRARTHLGVTPPLRLRRRRVDPAGWTWSTPDQYQRRGRAHRLVDTVRHARPPPPARAERRECSSRRATGPVIPFRHSERIAASFPHAPCCGCPAWVTCRCSSSPRGRRSTADLCSAVPEPGRQAARMSAHAASSDNLRSTAGGATRMADTERWRTAGRAARGRPVLCPGRSAGKPHWSGGWPEDSAWLARSRRRPS